MLSRTDDSQRNHRTETLTEKRSPAEVYVLLVGQVGRVKNDRGPFRQRDVATRQAYLWTAFFVFSAVFFLVVFLAGGPPLSKPVDLLSLTMCVVFALSWLSYAAGGLGQSNRRTRGQ